MRTRNADSPKIPTTVAKKTPPVKKSASKTPPTPAEQPPAAVTPKSTETKRASAAKGKQVKTTTPKSNLKPTVKAAKASADAVEATPETAKALDEATPKTAKGLVEACPETFNASADAVEATPETAKALVEATPETAKASANAVEGTPETVKALVEATPKTKVVSGTKTTRKVIVKRTVLKKKTPASAKAGASKTPTSAEAGKAKVQEPMEKKGIQSVKNVESVEESTKKEGVQSIKDVETSKSEEPRLSIVEDSSAKKEEPLVDNVETSAEEGKDVADAQQTTQEMEVAGDAQPSDVGSSSKHEVSIVTDVGKITEDQQSSIAKEKENVEVVEEIGITDEVEPEIEPVNMEVGITEDKVDPENEPVNMEEDINEELKREVPEEDVSDEKMEEVIGHETHEEFGEEEFAEDKVSEHGVAGEALDDEHAELTAAAKERKIRKELEIFVGGLDREATEEDVKKAFANVGEVVDVRLHKDLSTNKNKGYAFVRFAKKEQATRALSEMKNPVIHGKRCGTAPSEDNDTLFLGYICNTWTKEAISQKLKDYGIESVENITLVADAKHDGLSRGFAFLEFKCHPDAMVAYKRLQKPDVIFGHSERTAKVAFAEPLRDPDPEVLAKVKSVFVDGLPPHWDEDTVREQFKGYGEIERIMLARNMPSAKRKDFGFVDYTTHEAAVACINEINNRELGDGNSKLLSAPCLCS